MRPQIVEDGEWARKYRKHGKLWPVFAEGIELVRDGHRIKLPAGQKPERTRRNFQEYCRRAGIPVATSVTPDLRWVYVRAKGNAQTQHVRKFAVKSHERGNLASDSTTTNSAGGVQPTKPAQALSRRAV